MNKTTSIVGPRRYVTSVLHMIVNVMPWAPQHWHGFFQKGTTWADGPAFVSQCPITSGNSFVYDFTAADQSGKLSYAEQPMTLRSDRDPFTTGTFWYHSHLTTQYCDGLRGPLVVYDPEDPLKQYYDVDDGMFFRWMMNRIFLTTVTK